MIAQSSKGKLCSHHVVTPTSFAGAGHRHVGKLPLSAHLVSLRRGTASGTSATAARVLAKACDRFRFASIFTLRPQLGSVRRARAAPSTQRIGSIPDTGIDLIKICRRDAIGRHHVDRVAEWAEQEISALEEGQKLRTDACEIARIAGF